MTIDRFIRFAAFAFVVAAAALPSFGCRKPKDPENPAQVKEKLMTGSKFALWKLDATDPQKKQFDSLLDGLSVDLFAVQQENNALVKRVMNALDAPTVDAAEIEKAAVEGSALFERYLRRMLRAAVDVSKILTQQQRHKIIKIWREYEFGS